jgi:LuxR family transcriptional regulator, maltose regulon positive regulatory protein
MHVAPGRSRRTGRSPVSFPSVVPVLQPLLVTKLSPPPTVAGLVQRTEILELIRATDATIVSVCAPAGYGKTTLLSQIAESASVRVAWVSLDASDDDPVHLLAELAATLDRGDSLHLQVMASLQSVDPSLYADVLPRLLNSLTQTGGCILILDDVDRVRSGPGRDVIAYLCEHLPLGVRMVLASRTYLGIPLGRMRAHRRLLELGPTELSLSRTQAQQVFENASAPVAADVFDALYAQTEGWPVGIYLAALAARGAADPDQIVRDFDGADATVVEYLTTEILGPEIDERRRFLEFTSVLERFSAPLCDAVLGRTDSAVILKALERSNGFVVALDRRHQWYRYHPIFRQVLRAELARHDPGRPVEILQRASLWYEAADDLEAAIDNAFAARDEIRVADVLCRHLRQVSAQTPWITLRRWLDVLSDATIAAHPALCVAGAWTTFSLGNVDEVHRYLRLAKQAPAPDAAPCPFDEGSSQSALTLLRGTLAWEGVSSMNRQADSIRAVEPRESRLYRFAGLCLGASLFLHDRNTAAQRPLREAADAGPGSADIAGLARALLALLEIEDRRFGDADETIRDALAEWEGTSLDERLAATPLFAAQARLATERGDLAAAREFLNQALVGLQRTSVIPWLSIYVHIVLGRVALVLDDTSLTAWLLENARRGLVRYPDAGVLPHMMARVEHAHELARGGGRQLLEPLTQAELRVLELAPTYMSVEEIGRELCVSRNTVKSHLKAIYDKLDVASRGEAVQRARVLRLIQRHELSNAATDAR